MRSIVVHNFRRKSSNVRIFQLLVGNSFINLLAEKLPHFDGFYKKFIRPIFKLNVFNFIYIYISLFTIIMVAQKEKKLQPKAKNAN